MAVRVTMSTRDLRRLIDLGDPARLDDDGGPFPASILRELADVVACDNVT